MRAEEIGVHTCPGGDRDSTLSADVDYAGLPPALFCLKVGSFYIQPASEGDRRRVLTTIRKLLKPGQMIFVGVTDPINPKIESPEEVRDRVLEAAEFIPHRSERPTIAASHPSRMTCPRRGIRPSQK
jgi:methionine synthase II (cobalamin-independent)